MWDENTDTQKQRTQKEERGKHNLMQDGHECNVCLACTRRSAHEQIFIRQICSLKQTRLIPWKKKRGKLVKSLEEDNFQHFLVRDGTHRVLAVSCAINTTWVYSGCTFRICKFILSKGSWYTTELLLCSILIHKWMVLSLIHSWWQPRTILSSVNHFAIARTIKRTWIRLREVIPTKADWKSSSVSAIWINRSFIPIGGGRTYGTVTAWNSNAACITQTRSYRWQRQSKNLRWKKKERTWGLHPGGACR